MIKARLWLLGPGGRLWPMLSVGTQARQGVGTIVSRGAVIDHHRIEDDLGHLGVNASMAGGAVLSRGHRCRQGPH